MLTIPRRVNYPILSMSHANIEALMRGECRLIVADRFLEFSEVKEALTDAVYNDGVAEVDLYSGKEPGIFFDGVYVGKSFLARGYDHNFFRQSVKGKSVWCMHAGPADMMSWEPNHYVLTDQGSEPDNMTAFQYKVEVVEETTLGDVLANSYKYTLDYAAKVWRRCTDDEADRNFNKYRVSFAIYKHTGDDGARVADLTKVVSYLVGAVSSVLNEEELDALSPFIDKGVGIDTIRRVALREAHINKLVEAYKSGNINVGSNGV